MDITDIKKAEEKIRESEKRLTDLLEAVPVGISITDIEGKIIECNSNMFKIFGYDSKDEFIEILVSDHYYNPNDREKFIELAERGLVKDFVVEFKRKDGSIFWGSLTSIAQKMRDQITFITSLQDITERKITDIKIQQSEAELSAIYNYAPLAILLVDHERRIRKINKFALKFTDRKEEEVFGIYGGEALRCLYSIIDPKGCGFSEYCQDCTIRNTVLDTFKTRTPYINVEATLNLLPSGDTNKVHLLISTVPLKFDGEDLVLVSLIDITDRKKAEQELKESEIKYRDLFENSPIALIEQDFSELKTYLDDLRASGVSDFEKYLDENPEEIINFTSMIKLIDINRKTVELYNINSKDDFIKWKCKMEKRLFQEDMTPEVLLANKQELLSLIHGETTFESEVGTKTFTGEKIYVYMKTLIIPGYEKTWSKVIVSLLDISNRIKTELKLKESEEKFRTIAEQSSLGMIIQQDGFIKFANSAVSDIIEYPLEKIHKLTAEETLQFIYKDDLPLIIDKLKQRQEGDFEAINQYECRAIAKSGKIKWINVYTKPIIYQGKNAVLSTFIDITEKKKVEEELKDVSRLKSDLISRTSHELKTPLVSIKGYADLLLSQHYEELDFYTISVLHEIKQGCYRLESLIKDLLETSELETGEVELNKLKDDLAFLIRYCVKDLKGLIETRKHNLILDIPENLVTLFEKERLYEVIINLLSNAIKYTPPNGQIIIKSKIRDNNYIISIKDNGIGLTDEEKEKIFKKFGKIERYGKGMDVVSEGSGLGLYISKKIIELHEGHIWVESKGRDKGSKFSFSIPILKA